MTTFNPYSWNTGLSGVVPPKRPCQSVAPYGPVKEARNPRSDPAATGPSGESCPNGDRQGFPAYQPTPIQQPPTTSSMPDVINGCQKMASVNASEASRKNDASAATSSPSLSQAEGTNNGRAASNKNLKKHLRIIETVKRIVDTSLEESERCLGQPNPATPPTPNLPSKVNEVQNGRSKDEEKEHGPLKLLAEKRDAGDTLASNDDDNTNYPQSWGSSSPISTESSSPCSPDSDAPYSPGMAAYTPSSPSASEAEDRAIIGALSKNEDLNCDSNRLQDTDDRDQSSNPLFQSFTLRSPINPSATFWPMGPNFISHSGSVMPSTSKASTSGSKSLRTSKRIVEEGLIDSLLCAKPALDDRGYCEQTQDPTKSLQRDDLPTAKMAAPSRVRPSPIRFPTPPNKRRSPSPPGRTPSPSPPPPRTQPCSYSSPQARRYSPRYHPLRSNQPLLNAPRPSSTASQCWSEESDIWRPFPDEDYQDQASRGLEATHRSHVSAVPAHSQMLKQPQCRSLPSYSKSISSYPQVPMRQAVANTSSVEPTSHRAAGARALLPTPKHKIAACHDMAPRDSIHPICSPSPPLPCVQDVPYGRADMESCLSAEYGSSRPYMAAEYHPGPVGNPIYGRRTWNHVMPPSTSIGHDFAPAGILPDDLRSPCVPTFARTYDQSIMHDQLNVVYGDPFQGQQSPFGLAYYHALPPQQLVNSLYFRESPPECTQFIRRPVIEYRDVDYRLEGRGNH